jgi:hypothetical protein
MLITEIIGGHSAVHQYFQEILSMFGHNVDDIYKQLPVQRITSVISNVNSQQVSMRFKTQDGQDAKAVWQLISRDPTDFKRKIISASYTIERPTGGYRSFERADDMISNGLRSRGIAILTNPNFWNLIGFEIKDVVSWGKQR